MKEGRISLVVQCLRAVGFPGGASGKKNLANAGDTRDLGWIPGLESQLQYSCLENPMDRGAWQAAVHGVAKSQT